MSGERVERRLAAILAVDVAGYSRLMGEDEEGTLRNLKAHRSTLLDPSVAEHRGRIVKTSGDGLLAEFQSVVDAVRCAVEIQRGMAERNAAAPEGERIEFRIGVNLGDVIVDDGDIFGDGVNIAARLEALAEPGGICLSAAAHEQVRDKLDLAFEVNHLGAYDLYLCAYAMMLSPARRVAELARLLDQAIACDPEFGPALALAAAFHMNSEIFAWCEDPEDNRRKGLERGQRALLVAGDDPAVLAMPPLRSAISARTSMP
jgi:class 3 adenylate cyclase